MLGVLLFLCCVNIILPIFSVVSATVVRAESWEGEEEIGDVWASGILVKREERTSLFSSEYGEISAVRMGHEDIGATYLVHFFTLEPNSLFLPVFLHDHMVFYVQTGGGKLSWAEENDLKDIDLKPGDAFRLQAGTVFFIQSNLETEPERHKLRIHAIFADSNDEPLESKTGPYSSIRDMVLGFDKKVLQAAFKVSEELMEELLNGAKLPAIVHGVPKTKKKTLEMEVQFISGLVRSRGNNIIQINKKKREKTKLFNFLEEKKDFENDNGWSTTVTGKKFSVLKDSNIGLFMVNLTRGSMMGPHWNPMANEIGIVWQGRGIVRIVCSSTAIETGCESVRFKVEEGDVFAVPRLHPMAQMAFENDTFVFAGFSTSAKRNHPQFFAGRASVLKTLDNEVVSMSFNVPKATMDQLLALQKGAVILGCTSCAEEELRVMEEEMEKAREEARQREEEEARKREEEKARREEEERKRQEEEVRKREEEEAKREEEERKRHEEEAERQREEEERKKKEEEAERKREGEEEEERRQSKEEARRKEDEEAKREEQERKRREEEAEERRRREEEAQRKEEEEAEREEAERKRQEEPREREEEERRKGEEEEARATEEEEAKREEEEATEEEERRRKEEEAEGREEEAGWEEEPEERREMERARKEAEKREEEKARQEEEARARKHPKSEEEWAEPKRKYDGRRWWKQKVAEEEVKGNKLLSFSWNGK
ncbi:vicilin-like seed storage protein At4g36700 [Primulina eburnea]|uniref:vicilin-like seed storage protein At4g36700 n=1 Tax=Primulina eburnea TaxID=1245227 RepID=UPI003C6BE291